MRRFSPHTNCPSQDQGRGQGSPGLDIFLCASEYKVYITIYRFQLHTGAVAKATHSLCPKPEVGCQMYQGQVQIPQDQPIQYKYWFFIYICECPPHIVIVVVARAKIKVSVVVKAATRTSHQVEVH